MSRTHSDAPVHVPTSAPPISESGALRSHTASMVRLPRTREWLREWLISNRAKLVGLLVAAFVIQASLAMRGMAPVFDEEEHITAGYMYWQFRNGTFNYQQPPLVKLLAATPLLLIHPEIATPPRSDRQGDYDPFAADFLSRNQARLDLILFLARLPMVILAAGLGVAIFAWSQEVFGLRAAFVALMLYCFEPNFLGHSGLVFMDVPLAAMSFFSLYALWKWTQKPSAASVLVAGLTLGLAILTKFPALVLSPIFVLLLGFEFMRGPRTRPSAVTYARALMGIHTVALVVVLIVYGAFFGTEHLVRPDRPNYALGVLVDLTHRLPSTVMQPVETSLRYLGTHFPVVGMDYIRGLVWQRTHVREGMPAFLFGQYSSHGWWYFHFVAMALKTTTPMLVLIGLRLLASPWLPWQPVERFLIVPALVTLALSAVSPFGTGLRYLFPAYPFLIMLVSRLGTVSVKRQVLWGGVLASLLAWHVVSAVRVHPYYLAFFNEVSGGPAQGYKYLVGSNLDFGQDLKRLGEALQGSHRLPLYLSVHTTVDPTLYGIRSLPLPPDGRCRTGTIAISATHLQGVAFDPQAFAWLRERTPKIVVGYSIFVYDNDRCPPGS